MKAFLYGAMLQWKLDIRSKALLITCYVVPLLFFSFMGGIFTSINPQAKFTLIQSMTVMGVTMGAMIGLPPSLVEVYATDVQKMYRANGVPNHLGVLTLFLSAFVHLLLMSAIIYIVAPLAFDAVVPESLPRYMGSLAVFIAVSLSIGCVLGLLMKNQAKLTMVSQLFFLPSIMLSGIMFPIEMLPQFLGHAGNILPATWGYRLMAGDAFTLNLYAPLLLMFVIAVGICLVALSKKTVE